MRLIVYVLLFVARWYAVIGAFRNVCEITDGYVLPLRVYGRMQPLIDWINKHWKFFSAFVTEFIVSLQLELWRLCLVVLATQSPRESHALMFLTVC